MSTAMQVTADGFDRWRLRLQSVCGAFDAIPPASRALFIGAAEGAHVGQLEIAHIRTNALRIFRERANADRAEDRFCFLIYQRAGVQSIRQGDQDVKLMAGDFALVDSLMPFEIKPEGLIDNLSIHLRRDLVAARLGAAPCFGRVDKNCVGARLLRSLIEPISHQALPRATVEEGCALEDALVALLPPAMQSVYPPIEFADSELDLGSAAKRLIDQSLDDPELTPAKLAAHMNVSVRRLYRLFEHEGDSVCRYIQHARLTRIARMLRDPMHASESITSVAFRWGFNDAAHFSRTFKRQFGCSPRDYRLHSVA